MSLLITPGYPASASFHCRHPCLPGPFSLRGVGGGPPPPPLSTCRSETGHIRLLSSPPEEGEKEEPLSPIQNLFFLISSLLPYAFVLLPFIFCLASKLAERRTGE